MMAFSQEAYTVGQGERGTLSMLKSYKARAMVSIFPSRHSTSAKINVSQKNEVVPQLYISVDCGGYWLGQQCTEPEHHGRQLFLWTISTHISLP